MVLIVSRQFALDLITWPTIANAIGTSALNNKVRDYPMEGEAIIKIMLSQVNEVFNRAWSILLEELNFHDTLFGVDFCYFHNQLVRIKPAN